MTVLLAWPNKIEHPTAIYLLADSRVSQVDTKARVVPGFTWNYSSKLFRVFPSQDYVAYCGSSHHWLTVISQSMHLLASSNVLRGENDISGPDAGSRAMALVSHLRPLLKEFPDQWKGGGTLLYTGISRDTRKPTLLELDLNETGRHFNEITFSTERHYVSRGSGAVHLKGLPVAAESRKSPQFVSAVVELITSGRDPQVGGYPQMVSVSCSKTTIYGFNVTEQGRKMSTLFGMPLRFKRLSPSVVFRALDFRKAEYVGGKSVHKVSQRRGRK